MVGSRHGDGFGVGPGIEGDLIGRQEAIEGRHAVGSAERRDCSLPAIIEDGRERALACEADILGPENLSQLVKIDHERRGQHDHHQPAVRDEEHGLGELVSGAQESRFAITCLIRV